jgi:hypothetical protein
VAALWLRIHDLIIKTLIAMDPQVNAGVDMFLSSPAPCFELFGFDVLVDDGLQPHLLEVNFAPSLACDSPLDLRIKAGMLADVLSLAGIPWPAAINPTADASTSASASASASRGVGKRACASAGPRMVGLGACSGSSGGGGIGCACAPAPGAVAGGSTGRPTLPPSLSMLQPPPVPPPSRPAALGAAVCSSRPGDSGMLRGAATGTLQGLLAQGPLAGRLRRRRQHACQHPTAALGPGPISPATACLTPPAAVPTSSSTRDTPSGAHDVDTRPPPLNKGCSPAAPHPTSDVVSRRTAPPLSSDSCPCHAVEGVVEGGDGSGPALPSPAEQGAAGSSTAATAGGIPIPLGTSSCASDGAALGTPAVQSAPTWNWNPARHASTLPAPGKLAPAHAPTPVPTPLAARGSAGLPAPGFPYNGAEVAAAAAGLAPPEARLVQRVMEEVQRGGGFRLVFPRGNARAYAQFFQEVRPANNALAAFFARLCGDRRS